MITASLTCVQTERKSLFGKNVKTGIRVAFHQHFANQRCGKNPQHKNHCPYQHWSLSSLFLGSETSGYSIGGAI